MPLYWSTKQCGDMIARISPEARPLHLLQSFYFKVTHPVGVCKTIVNNGKRMAVLHLGLHCGILCQPGQWLPLPCIFCAKELFRYIKCNRKISYLQVVSETVHVFGGNYERSTKLLSDVQVHNIVKAKMFSEMSSNRPHIYVYISSFLTTRSRPSYKISFKMMTVQVRSLSDFVLVLASLLLETQV